MVKENYKILLIKKLNLFYNYGQKHALFDISLEIPEKNVIAIIGPSGCGKSTFLRCINRMNDLIDGTEITGKIIFQEANIYGRIKKASKEEQKKLKILKMKLLKNSASINEIKRKATANLDLKKENVILMQELTKLKKEAGAQLKKINDERKYVINYFKNQIAKERKKDFRIYIFSKIPSIISMFEERLTFDQNYYLKIIEMNKNFLEQKKKYKSEIKKIKNHVQRKTRELKDAKKIKIDGEVNRLIKEHFSHLENYDELYQQYERQFRKVKGWKPDEVRTKIGLVFQKPNPFAKSIFENIAFGLRNHGITDPTIVYNAVEEALNDAGLWNEVKDRLNESALALSGGQQQRLCIARAIVLKPKILLMDEPTSSLDPIGTRKIEELIRELRKKYTIIIVTHSMQQAARISDYTAFFYQGKLIEYGRTQQIFKNPKVEMTKKYIVGDFG